MIRERSLPHARRLREDVEVRIGQEGPLPCTFSLFLFCETRGVAGSTPILRKETRAALSRSVKSYQAQGIAADGNAIHEALEEVRRHLPIPLRLKIREMQKQPGRYRKGSPVRTHTSVCQNYGISESCNIWNDSQTNALELVHLPSAKGNCTKLMQRTCHFVVNPRKQMFT